MPRPVTIIFLAWTGLARFARPMQAHQREQPATSAVDLRGEKSSVCNVRRGLVERARITVNVRTLESLIVINMLNYQYGLRINP